MFQIRRSGIDDSLGIESREGLRQTCDEVVIEDVGGDRGEDGTTEELGKEDYGCADRDVLWLS